MKMNKFFGRPGLGPYLALMTAVMMLLLTAATVQMIGMAVTKRFEADIGRSLEELAFQTSDKLDRGMFERYREVQLMAERTELGHPTVTAEAKRALIEDMQRTYPYYAWIGLTDNDGRVEVATGKMLEGADVSKRPWFGNAYRNIHLTDVHEAVLLAKLLPNPSNEPKRFFDVAFPYARPDGKTAGILGIHLSWQWAQEIEKSVLRPLAQRKKVDTLIVSQSGKVLLGPQELADAQLNQPSFRQAQTARPGFVIEQWPNGKQYLVGFSKSNGYRSYPGFGWTVLVRQELDEAYRPVAELQNTIFWSGLAAAGVFALLAFFVATRITRPLRAIAHSARDIETGKAHALRIKAGGFDEVIALGNSLNSLLQKLAANEQSLRDLNASLEARVVSRTADLAAAVDELKISERRVRSIINSALDAFVGIDTEGRITDWNPQAEAIFGWTREEVLGKPAAATIIPERLRRSHEQGLANFNGIDKSTVVGQRLQLSALRRNGEEFPIEMTIGLVDAGNGHFFGAFIHDISARKQTELELQQSRQRLATIADNMPATILYIDQQERYQFCNKTYEAWFNRPAHAIQGKTIAEVFREQGYGDQVYCDVQPYVRQALAGQRVTFEVERVIRGEPRHLEVTYIPQSNAKGEVAGIYAMVNDITVRKNQELQFAHHATHDALTGLANRRAFMDRLREAIARAERRDKALAVLFLDLNKFKQINDTYGHAVGDRTLVAFAARLQQCVRKVDTVARLAGDEFVILVEDLNQAESDAALIAEKIVRLLAKPLVSDGVTIIGATSIGIAIGDGRNGSPEDMLARADQAMYQAKQSGANAWRFWRGD